MSALAKAGGRETLPPSRVCPDCGVGVPPESACACGGPERLGEHYELIEVLGQRGSGATYRAWDHREGRPCVVKELRLRISKSMREVELFEREASLLRSVAHERIPRLFDAFESRRGKSIALYIVQEHVEGTSLEEEVVARRFTPAEVAGVMAQVCETLAYLQQRDVPILHRDIKPANLIRRSDGSIAIVGFGAARAVAESLHRSGSTMSGTFGYMAPEQLIGEARPASDIFGLGATALRLLTGREPGELWSGGHRFEYDRDALDRDLVAVIDAMTHPDWEARPVASQDLANHLRSHASGSRGQLARYGDRRLVSPSGDRPIVRHAAASLGEILAIQSIFFLVFGGYLYAAAVSAPPGVRVAIGGAFLALLLLATFSFKRDTLHRGKRLLQLVRYPCVRGILSSRERDGRHYLHTFSYVVDGEEHTATSMLSVREASFLEPGDEVAVCYDPRRPERSTLAPLRPGR